MVSKVELLVTDQNGDKYYIDLENTNVGINMNYSIDDVRSIEKKNGNFSKTFTVPGTKNNNEVFGHLFDVNTTFSQYNPNLRVDAVLLQDSSPLIEGYLQLKSVKKLNNADLQGNLIKYDIILFDSSIDFFQQLGDKELIDLDLSDYTHTYDRTTIENAWATNTFNELYQYPLLDKIGEGYKVSNFKPAVYSKGILNKIAQEAGYTLEGDFMDNESSFEQELILWDGNTPELTKSEAASREFRASFTGTSVTIDSGIKNSLTKTIKQEFSPGNVFDYDDVLFDNSGNYVPNDSLGGNEVSTWFAPKTGTYTFTIKQNFIVNYSASRACETYFQVDTPVTPQLWVGILLKDYNTGTVLASNSVKLGTLGNFTSSGTKTIQRDVDANITLKLNENQKVYVEYFFNSNKRFGWVDTSGPFYVIEPVTMTFIANKTQDNGTDSVFYNKTSLIQNIEYGDDVELGLYLPKAIKQRDFISDIIKRFNLYIRPNPSKIRTLILETRDVFYSNTEVLDWTQKKDYSSEDQIAFLTELQNKEILYTYKADNSAVGADNEKWNEIYTKSTGDIYGQKKIVFDNDFVKGTKKIESLFSTAPLIFREENGVVVPAVSSNDGKRNPVVAYWGGKIPVKDNDGVLITDLFEIDWSGTTVTYADYPYAGHYDNPYNPTEDIHFGEVTYEFYGLLLNYITDNNLFNKYWRNYISQISTGKLVTSYFRLTETDINKIKDNLSPRIFVKDSYYVINKIVDYKPLEEGLTKVELLYIEKGSTFEPTTATTESVVQINPDLFISEIVTTNQIFSGPIRSNVTNEVHSRDVLVLGEDNYVGENVTGIINGSNNNVGGGSENIHIQGNNNVVSPGLSNVYAIGDDLEVTDSNTFILPSGRIGLWEFTDNESILSYNSVNANIIDPTSNQSIIAGGITNTVNGDFSAIVGGFNNVVNNSASFIGGGNNNNANGNLSFIGGGSTNTASNTHSAIVGGVNNIVTNDESIIAGGNSNNASGLQSGIIAGNSNNASGLHSGIIAGNTNNVSGDFSVIAGGQANTINTPGGSGILAGDSNTINGTTSAIAGGSTNIINGDFGFIAGGTVNTLNGSFSAIIGGNGITGNANDTVYVPNLVFKPSVVPTTSSDPAGEVGQITYDVNYVYLKTASGWGRILLDYLF